MSNIIKKARKRLQGYGQINRKQFPMSSPASPYYWQWRTYMALQDFKN